MICVSQHAAQPEAKDYLHDVELRQQVAVGQSKLVAIQEGTGGGNNIVRAILVDLVRMRGTEVVVQLL